MQQDERDHASLVGLVDHRLDDLTAIRPGVNEVLGQAVRDSLLGPGKRLRPILTILVARELGGPPAAALDAGCAVEMIHAASLILDDLPCMDDAAMRRGRPTAHRAFGEDVALLASVALQAQAYGLLARLPDCTAVTAARCVAVLADAVGPAGLVTGQLEDLRNVSTTVAMMDEVDRINASKTGALFRAAVDLGALVSGADLETRRLLETFATQFGLVFQLLDDLLDADGALQVSGKDVGKDRDKGTIASRFGKQATLGRVAHHLSAADAAAHQVFGPASAVARLLHDAVETGSGTDAPGTATRLVLNGRGTLTEHHAATARTVDRLEPADF